jgi:heme oxygenase
MLARLGRETLPHHSDADSDIDRFLFGATTSVADYRSYLVRIYGFIVPFENALAATPALDEVIDVRMRSKTALVLNDLYALGMTDDDVAAIPTCITVPSFRGAAAALGWMYVAERPVLASAVIRRHLVTRLPEEMTRASAFLSCYSGQVGTMWRELGEAIDRVAITPIIADRIVHAAHDAFRALHRWRTQDLQRAAFAS